ncbi:MAG: RNA-binding domain-containing protein [Methanocellales archaeon]|nr:RNA-binding domain-containing protein [Methanocellales archaeon]
MPEQSWKESKVKVRVWAPVYATESVERVKKVVTNIFPDARLRFEEDKLTGDASLDKLQELLRKQKIRDSARTVLLNCKKGNKIEFDLNKQVAFVGKVNFGSSSLGSIHVSIETVNPDELIDWLASSSEVKHED